MRLVFVLFCLPFASGMSTFSADAPTDSAAECWLCTKKGPTHIHRTKRMHVKCVSAARAAERQWEKLPQEERRKRTQSMNANPPTAWRAVVQIVLKNKRSGIAEIQKDVNMVSIVRAKNQSKLLLANEKMCYLMFARFCSKQFKTLHSLNKSRSCFVLSKYGPTMFFENAHIPNRFVSLITPGHQKQS